jgi:hypothetical protein
VGRRSGSSKSVVEVGRCRLCSKRAGIGRLNESRWTRSSLSLKGSGREVKTGKEGRKEGGLASSALRGLDRLSSFKVGWKGGRPCQWRLDRSSVRVVRVVGVVQRGGLEW